MASIEWEAFNGLLKTLMLTIIPDGYLNHLPIYKEKNSGTGYSPAFVPSCLAA
jgi:hypothetical protein